MKKLIGSIVLAVMFTSVQAQTIKGTKVVGGGFQLQIEKDHEYAESETKTTDFSFIPSVGYFVIDNLAVGINFNYSNSKTEYTILNNSNTSKSSSFAVGPFARYYMHTSNEDFIIYGQVTTLFGSGKETDINDNKTKTSSFDIALSPGLTYFFNEHWAVELGFRGFGYNKQDPDKDTDDDEYSTFQIGLNSLMPSALGFRYYFK